MFLFRVMGYEFENGTLKFNFEWALVKDEKIPQQADPQQNSSIYLLFSLEEILGENKIFSITKPNPALYKIQYLLLI